MLIGIIVVIAAMIIWAVIIYNSLISSRNQVAEAWSDIDVQLKRRYDLIPNLIESVKGYKEYESSTLQKVTELRQQAMSAQSVADKGKAETALSAGLMNIFAVAENYPALKANENFLDLQKNLSDIENQIQNARRYYNGTTREYNTKIQTFPNSIISSAFHFTTKELFSLEFEAEKQNPKVSF